MGATILVQSGAIDTLIRIKIRRKSCRFDFCAAFDAISELAALKALQSRRKFRDGCARCGTKGSDNLGVVQRV